MWNIERRLFHLARVEMSTYSNSPTQTGSSRHLELMFANCSVHLGHRDSSQSGNEILPVQVSSVDYSISEQETGYVANHYAA